MVMENSTRSGSGVLCSVLLESFRTAVYFHNDASISGQWRIAAISDFANDMDRYQGIRGHPTAIQEAFEKGSNAVRVIDRIKEEAE